jgi:phospholipase C
MMAGEAFVACVYNAIRSNQALWRSALLIVTFDEHGGYYDHVQPPAAPPPDKCTLEYAFDRLGVRVPAILVSPWVPVGVFPADTSVHFDHTSVGRYLCDKWALTPLGERMRQACSVGMALQLNAPPRLDVLPEIPAVPVGEPVAAGTPNKNQVALDVLSRYLDKHTPGPTRVVVPRVEACLLPTSSTALASSRVAPSQP